MFVPAGMMIAPLTPDVATGANFFIALAIANILLITIPITLVVVYICRVRVHVNFGKFVCIVLIGCARIFV
jgi:hypothetical protein